MRHKLLTSSILASLVLPLLVGCQTKPAGEKDEPYPLSGDVVKHSFVSEANLIHVRFPGNDNGAMGNEEDGFGVNWGEYPQSEKDSFDLDNVNSSFARMVLNAPFTGDYNAYLNAKNFNLTYPTKIYINTKDTSKRFSVSITSDTAWSKEENQSSSFTLPLEKGKNVVFVQVYDWGTTTGFTLPKEVEVIKVKGNKTGEYVQDDFIYQAAYVDSSVDITDPNASIKYKGLDANGNPDYEASAILHFTPATNTKSLDITYKVEEKDAGSAGLIIRCGTSASSHYDVDLSSVDTNKELTVHIPSYELADLGFVGGTKQNIHVSSLKGKLNVLKIKESTVEDKEPGGMKTLNVAEIKEKTLIRGRNISSNSYIGLDWTSAGLEFEITGGGNITMNMEEVNDAFGNKGSAAGGTRFAVEIDGTLSKYVTPSTNMSIATNLSASKHKIALYKTSEAAGGLVNLYSMKVSESATVSKTTKAYKFEVLGDSITCGNQISASEENGYLSYATQLSNSWNANLNVISCSGRGLYIGYNSEEVWAAKYDNQVNSLWTETSFFRDNGASKWSATNYVPDVVICNLGNNDLGDWPVTIMEGTTPFMNEVKSFSAKLRTAYPNAKIIWCYGAFVNRNYADQYRQAVESLNDASMDFVYFDQMGGGADGHPNATQHQTIADILSAKIATMLGTTNPR